MKNLPIIQKDAIEANLEIISKIYESFEALEETLGKLNLEEPLFITYVAKKAFATTIFNEIKQNTYQDLRTRH